MDNMVKVDEFLDAGVAFRKLLNEATYNSVSKASAANIDRMNSIRDKAEAVIDSSVLSLLENRIFAAIAEAKDAVELKVNPLTNQPMSNEYVTTVFAAHFAASTIGSCAAALLLASVHDGAKKKLKRNMSEQAFDGVYAISIAHTLDAIRGECDQLMKDIECGFSDAIHGVIDGLEKRDSRRS